MTQAPRQAGRLLHKAHSDRGPIQFRQGYFNRAEVLLSGLIALPVELRTEIVEAVRKPSHIEGTMGPGWGMWT